MGLFGNIKTSLLKGAPKLNPPAGDYTWDPYLSSNEFRGNQKAGEGAYFDSLMKYLNKEPGFDQETIRNMYEQPAEQTKLEEQGALRNLNQGASFRGSYDSGKRQAGRGQIMASGTRTRADLRRQTQLSAAQIALQDRLNQLQAAAQWANPRMAAGQGEIGNFNQYNLGRASGGNQPYDHYQLESQRMYEFFKGMYGGGGGFSGAGGMGGGGMGGGSMAGGGGGGGGMGGGMMGI